MPRGMYYSAATVGTAVTVTISALRLAAQKLKNPSMTWSDLLKVLAMVC